MITPTPGCAAPAESGSCTRPPTLARPLPLCDEHKIAVALAVVPDLLAGALVDIRADSYDSARILPEALAHIIDSATPANVPDTEQHTSLVYFLANGGRVKIGRTRGLTARVRALSLREDAVLLLLHGGPSLERALHQKFGGDRIGDSEWFELTPAIVRFIAKKQPTAVPHRPRRITPRHERIPRQQRARVRTDAEQSIAEAISRGENPNALDIGRHYGMGETWGGDRIRAVRARTGDSTATT
ncbi:GIY-YIG nuclease family protein [Streptomyces sp. NPDC052000]|uniref:GIY-YIG nuclease family protein n=1 Tax=Streptomyces sp. NPDC052000 TaxID=3155676 RepID=UPI00344EFCAE